jgi:hypothetical protein
MAQTICCPCGTPIDCDNLELVITVECPRCRKELNLEVDDSSTGRRGLLTVMEGPHWVGEQFLIPVGEFLNIGQQIGNWLCLEGPGVCDIHCRLKLLPDGAAIIEDQGSRSGTWIGEQRIAHGRLHPRDLFKVGAFLLRFDIAGNDGTISGASSQEASSFRLPTMTDVHRELTLGYRAYRNRFILSRYYLIAFAWLGGVFHMTSLHGNPKLAWPWHKAIVAGLLFMSGISLVSRRVTLHHARLKYLSLAFLISIAVTDVLLNLPGGAVAALLISLALLILIMRDPGQGAAVFGSILGMAGGITIAVCAYRSAVQFVNSGH